MSCIITYKGNQYSEQEFKNYFNINTSEFIKKVATNKSVINSFKNRIDAINFVFQQAPELENIGTKIQYLQYLSTIFPNSKVKDIVYHGSHVSNIEKFDFAKQRTTLTNYLPKGGYFTSEKLVANSYSDVKGKIYSVLLNLKNPRIIQGNEDYNDLSRTLQKEAGVYKKQGITNKEITDALESLNKEIINNNDGVVLLKIKDSATSSEFKPIYNYGELSYNEDNENTYVVFEPEQIHILSSKADIEGFKDFVQGKQTFDKELAKKIQDKLQKLYPEIKLNITNSPVWEQGDNIFDQKQALENEVAYRLKVVNSLINLTIPKGDKRYSLGDKPEVLTIRLNSKKQPYIETNLRKRLNGKGVTNQQIDFIFDYMKSNNIQEISTEQLALELASKYGFSVEINTAKTNRNLEDTPTATTAYRNFEFGGESFTKSDEMDFDGEYKEIYRRNGKQIKRAEFIEFAKKAEQVRVATPTQHYSNLTVPGGTNYTENEIATPAITPSIKGHAQFATDNGIGWFRSDEQITFDSGISEQEEAYYNPDTDEMVINDKGRKILGGKTRRILEVQSDLFQIGRDKEDLISKSYDADLKNKIKKAKEQNLDERYIEGLEQSLKLQERFKNISDNQFLQLLNKDNNWVTFFIKSIIQDSAKKGYEKVLFPTGNTASKVEGHSTLEEFKKQKEDRIKDLQQLIDVGGKKYILWDEEFPVGVFDTEEEAVKNNTSNYRIEIRDMTLRNKEEINQLKQELERVEREGFGALKPIYNFYENTITNILKKQGYNSALITDEYGNTWNEITINQARDLSDILLQRNEVNQIIGQANINALSVLIDAVNQKQDTLPHEYAHHYIAWFRNTPIVQEAIKKWGSEEALVQSIGEQVVKQKGEAYNWWNNFVKWIMNQFNSLSKLQKEELTQILTDAFLTRQDLNNINNQQFQKLTAEEKAKTIEVNNIIIEEDGSPVLFFVGTNKPSILQSRPSQEGAFGPGYYLTNSYLDAKFYSELKSKNSGGEPTVLAYYVLADNVEFANIGDDLMNYGDAVSLEDFSEIRINSLNQLIPFKNEVSLYNIQESNEFKSFKEENAFEDEDTLISYFLQCKL